MASNIQSDIFEELLTRHLKINRNYEAEDVKVLEMVVQPVGSTSHYPQKQDTDGKNDGSTFQSFVVKKNQVKGWLSKIISENAREGENEEHPYEPRLRVMLGSALIGSLGEYIGRGVADTQSRRKPSKPFLPNVYNLVEQAFRFPRSAFMVLNGAVDPLRGHFLVTQMPRDIDKPVFGFMLYSFSSLLVGLKASLAQSYDPSTGMINALVLLETEPPGEFGWLEEDLRQLAPLASNPFLLPTLVCQRHTEAISKSMRRTWDEFHALEISSGQTGITMFGVDQLGRCDDPRLPVSILGVAQVAIAIGAYIKAHLITVSLMRKELEAFPWDILPEPERARAREQNEILLKHMDWITHSLKIAEVQVGHLRQRAEVQATAINNVLAQRNNETNRIMVEASTSIAQDARRDSSAMKSIAVLTLIFLPATFTATYFSTPAVVALEPSQGIYWAITLALTVVVMVAWITFFYGWVATRLPLAKDYKSTV